ncbi:MAG TPA: hypothetical protein VEL74_24560 [Thermoanaerobaculia bacterium]|nr:hypothetical protein [Thermoanaerobaculia bacterium]
MKRLVFSALLLLLALGLGMAPDAAAKPGCTIACESDPTITCTSTVGDCSYYYGAYDYIVCNGWATRCPLP